MGCYNIMHPDKFRMENKLFIVDRADWPELGASKPLTHAHITARNKETRALPCMRTTDDVLLHNVTVSQIYP